MGLFQAIMEAVLAGADDFAGQSVTALSSALAEDETGSMSVASTIRFGRNVDSTDQARVLINGEIIEAQTRTLTSFDTLTRGVDTSRVRTHPFGSLVFDISFNRTARDLARRGFFVRTARLEDLDVIGRNLGLHKCPGLSEEQWRALIQVMAYLPNQPIDAFEQVLNVYPGVGRYRIIEDLTLDNGALLVTVEIDIAAFAGSGLRGKFFLNGGTPATADGTGMQVAVPNAIGSVFGVYDATPYTTNGEREGMTNYFLPGGAFAGNVITLDSPVTPGADVIVDYGAFSAHYLPADETVRYPADGDFFPYLSDPAAIVTCLLNQVRAGGVRVVVRTAAF